MKEPTRWLDDSDAPAHLRRVLGAAGAPPLIPPHTQAKLTAVAAGLAAHGAALPAAAAGSSVKSALAWLGASSAGKTVALVSLMGAIGSGSYWLTREVQHRSSTAPAPPAKVRTTLRAAASAVAPLASGSEVPSVEPTVVASAAVAVSGDVNVTLPRGQELRGQELSRGDVPLSRGDAPPSRHGAAAFDELSIADEARLLEQARSSLAANPARTLELASAHQALYPAGQLSAERELIVVDALLRLGRRQEAEQRAAPRLRQSPDSIYTRRLQKLLTPTGEQ